VSPSQDLLTPRTINHAETCAQLFSCASRIALRSGHASPDVNHFTHSDKASSRKGGTWRHPAGATLGIEEALHLCERISAGLGTSHTFCIFVCVLTSSSLFSPYVIMKHTYHYTHTYSSPGVAGQHVVAPGKFRDFTLTQYMIIFSNKQTFRLWDPTNTVSP
jgi:hypothetical protein